MVDASIKDSASPPGLRGDLTQSDGGCCIEHELASALEMRAGTGTQEKREEIGVKGHSSAPPRRTDGEWR